MERRRPLTPSMVASIMERKWGGGERGNDRLLRCREMRGRGGGSARGTGRADGAGRDGATAAALGRGRGRAPGAPSRGR
jgi:hypothetical protein